ncbi:MAG: hypothetical protein ACREL1_05670 [bacterium]
MRDWAKLASTFFLALVLGASSVCVYLSHLAINHTYDGMVFASLIEQRHPSNFQIFHPHHLIYNFLGRLFFLWGHGHGADWDGLGALQFFDLLTGCLGVLLIFHLLVRTTGDRAVAFLSALGLSFTYSYWYFSTSPGVRIFATVTPLLAWYSFSFLKDRGVFYGGVLGAAHALAVLGHQTNLLLLPAFLGGIWSVREKTTSEKWWISFFYLLFLTFGVLGAYAFVGRFLCDRTTYSAWVWWIMSYMHVKAWGGHLGAAGFERGKFAMVFAFLAGAYPTKPLGDHLTFGFAKGIFQDALWFVLAGFLIRIRSLWAKSPQALWITFFWLAAFVPFFVWWEPWNIEFWVSSTVPCWVLMGIVVSDLSLSFTNPVLRFANRAFFIFLWACLISLLFVYNFEGRAHKNPGTYANKTLMAALDHNVKSHDLLILAGINTIPFYIDRFDHRPYLNLHEFFRSYRPEEGEAPPPGDPWLDLNSIFQSAWNDHHRVWVLAEVVDPQSAWASRWEQLEKMEDGTLRNFFDQYDLSPVTYRDKVYFYEVLPKSDGTPVEDPGVSGVTELHP